MPDPDTWRYRCDCFGPSGSHSTLERAEGVVHATYAVDPVRPWAGVSPLAWARSTGTLAANLELRLGEEAGAVTGSLMPIPQDGGDEQDTDSLTMLKTQLAALRGKMALVETTASAWGEGRGNAPRQDWKQSRIGADPPQALATLRSDSAVSILAACGVPPSLATDSTGVGARESWRRFILATIEPALRSLAVELSAKLDVDLSFDLRQLWAHDLQGRASAFQKLVSAGLPVAEALVTSGLLAGDNDDAD